MTSKEALEKLSLMINREKHINSEWNKKINDLKQTIKQDLNLLNYLISLSKVKRGKIIIEIDKETNFETYTKIKECIINE